MMVTQFSVERFLDELAGGNPTPGGGSAAAITALRARVAKTDAGGQDDQRGCVDPSFPPGNPSGEGLPAVCEAKDSEARCCYGEQAMTESDYAHRHLPAFAAAEC